MLCVLLSAVLSWIFTKMRRTSFRSAAHSAVAPNSRGVTIVAGIHDTAINDCNGSGTATAPNLAAAAESLNNSSFPAGVTTVRVTMPWDVADPGIVLNTPQVANPAADEAELSPLLTSRPAMAS